MLELLLQVSVNGLIHPVIVFTWLALLSRGCFDRRERLCTVPVHVPSARMFPVCLLFSAGACMIIVPAVLLVLEHLVSKWLYGLLSPVPHVGVLTLLLRPPLVGTPARCQWST